MSAIDPAILLVEDSDTQALLTTHALECAGLAVHRVASAEAAIAYLEEHRPRLAVVDDHLPGMQGNALCRLLRNNPATAALLLLVLTDDAERKAEQRAFEGGADAYVAKSRDPGILLARVEGLLRQTHPADDAGHAGAFYRAQAILVVDPDETQRASVTAELSAEGYGVVAASNAAEAAAFARTSGVDCAIIAMRLPDVLSLCRELAGLREAGGGPVVMTTTAAASRDEMRQTLEAGVDDYLEESLDPAVLGGRVRALLRRKMFQDRQASARDEIRARAAELARLRAESEERVHLLLDSIGEGVLGADEAGCLNFANRAAREMLHLTEGEIAGTRIDQLFRPAMTAAADGPPEESPLAATLAGGAVLQAVEGTLGRRDGSRFPVEISCRPVTRAGALVGAVVSFEDISRRREMEMRLVQSQKMEAMGRLTGGVAHDFNNLLTVVIGNLQLLQRSVGEEPKIAGRLEKIMQAAKSGAELTRRLLSFSRQQVLETGVVDINEVVRDTAEMVRRTIADTITVTAAVAAKPCLGVTDREQLAHALLNLCFNARDAMPDGGRLTLETRLTVLDDGYAASRTDVLPGAYVEIAVSDTGTGIPPELREKIFEPFFTTKEKGKGTGLGLATVFGFMKQSGGHVGVYSEPGRGSTFRLYVPAALAGGPHPQPDTKSGPHTHAKKSATILVVEDEAAVREVAVATLREAGYAVVEACDGQVGLQAMEEHPEIAMVFSDIVMPGGMSGPEMVDRIRQKRPDVPVLFASGYAEQALRDRDALVGRARFIAKPYDRADLTERIQGLLDGASQ